MHRSRLCSVLIDCDEKSFEESVAFWSRALAREAIRGDARYVPLRGRAGGEGGVTVLLQRVASDERGLHLDIETDDVEAEVARLEQLGARQKRVLDKWTVMEAPSGHAFCVVPKFRGDFPAQATEWE